MSIDQANVVDAISTNGDCVILTISDHLDWDDEATHALALQDKINAYLDFMESGDILTVFPQAVGKALVIDIVMRVPPSTGGVAFLERVRPIVEDAGFELRSRVLDPKTRPS